MGPLLPPNCGYHKPLSRWALLCCKYPGLYVPLPCYPPSPWVPSCPRPLTPWLSHQPQKRVLLLPAPGSQALPGLGTASHRCFLRMETVPHRCRVLGMCYPSAWSMFSTHRSAKELHPGDTQGPEAATPWATVLEQELGRGQHREETGPAIHSNPSHPTKYLRVSSQGAKTQAVSGSHAEAQRGTCSPSSTGLYPLQPTQLCNKQG